MGGLDLFYGAGTSAAFRATLDIAAALPDAVPVVVEQEEPSEHGTVGVRVVWSVDGEPAVELHLDFHRTYVNYTYHAVTDGFRNRGLPKRTLDELICKQPELFALWGVGAIVCRPTPAVEAAQARTGFAWGEWEGERRFLASTAMGSAMSVYREQLRAGH